MKRIFCSLFVILLFSLPVCAEAAIDVLLDGTQIAMEDSAGNPAYPFISNGTTYVPLRSVANAFEIDCFWDASTKTVFLGERSGSPVLNDYINIFYDGEEFVARDQLGNVVHPVLSDGVTYLPVRAIGELFGKKVSWDSVSQTVVLASDCNDDALDYFKKSLSNTATAGVTAKNTFTATLSHDDVDFSTVDTSGEEEYKSGVFELSELLPEDYSSYISYSGDGTFFLAVPPSRFMFSSDVQSVLSKRSLSGGFSSLFVNVKTKGLYITDISIFGEANVIYEDFPAHVNFRITSALSYSEDFVFSVTPYPKKDSSDAALSADDSELISPVVNAYMKSLVTSDSESLLSLLYPSDYDSLFRNISIAQQKVKVSEANKSLQSQFAGIEGTFDVDSLAYIDVDESTYKTVPGAVVRALVTVPKTSGDVIELTLLFVKYGEKWYIDPSVVKPIFRLS